MTSLPWLRLYTELLSDRKIKLISAETGLPKPLIIGVWVSLLMLAGESPERGRIISARGKPWPFGFIADEIGLDESTCKQIIDEFIGMDMVYQDDEGAYVIVKWEERQFKSDDTYARVKKHRASKRGGPEDEGKKGGIEIDEYTKRFIGDNGNVSETFLETPQSQIQNPDSDLLPKGNGETPLLPDENNPEVEPEKEAEPEKDSQLLPDTPYSKLLFDKLTLEFKAKGRNPPKRFPSLACKRKFDARAGFLNGNLGTAIERALQKGIMSISEVTDFIAKYDPTKQGASNGNHQTKRTQHSTGDVDASTLSRFASKPVVRP